MIDANRYNILSNAIKNDALFVDELKNKYGNEFVREIIDYFDGKYEGSYYGDIIEEKIDKNLSDIISILNNRGSRSLSKTSTSSSDNNDQTKEIEHVFGNSYSGELAINILDDEIKRVSEEVSHLEEDIRNISLKDKKLRIELQRKKALLNILNDNRKQLSVNNSLDSEDVKLVNSDKKINEIELKIKEKEAELKSLNKELHSFRAKMINERQKKKLQNQINKLKASKGNLMARQRKVTSSKLKNIYKNNIKLSNKLGSKEATDMFRNERDERLNNVKKNLESKAKEADVEASRINRNILSVKGNEVISFVSYRAYDVVNKYCELLKKKDGKVDGLRQLPVVVKEAIINNSKSFVSNMVSGHSR